MIFDASGVQSVQSWYEILNWKELPNFGHFHTNKGADNFKRNYYVSDELKRFYLNLLETIKNNFNSANIRITGDPGAGKTSFLYSLLEQAKSRNSGFENYVFYIWHINKANGADVESEIQHHIKEAWKLYYTECGFSDEYIKVRQQDLPLKDMINRLSDIFKENRAKFEKVLFLVIDDVDLLDGSEVAEIVKCVMKNIEVASVKKWLVLRDVTYENYSAKTKDSIEHFFPDPFKFPTISLFELVSHRISNTSGPNKSENAEAKKPFSRELCDQIVLPMCDGSLRQGLQILKTILEDSLPKKIEPSSNDKFISNYLDKASINTLLSSNKLLNLHTHRYRNTFFPLAIDILVFASFHNSFQIIYGSVNDATVKRDRLAGKVVSDKDSYVKIREEDFRHSLNSLTEHGLITVDGKKTINITIKGRIHSVYITRDHYYEYCKKRESYLPDNDHYWQLAKVNINHKEILATLLTWQETHGKV